MNRLFDGWAKGLGVIEHSEATQDRVRSLLDAMDLAAQENALNLFIAADKLCNMGMWLTAHMTYAKNVYLDGRKLSADDFKSHPEGHTGGALNMVPAYVGYMLANALSGKTRAWLMGQGHCVAAIDSINVLLRNVEQEQDQRYPFSDAGLSQLCRDFYSYAYDENGKPSAPLGSHVNVYTAGGIIEGGYLGFAELQYVHMPLPGQELVTFLSDGAFEEQRGSDWASRWWRGEDTGLVMPIMIANGRRIDQRCTMTQCGGVEWFKRHLQLNGFMPIEIDGRDPAAFAWAILHMGKTLEQDYQAVQKGEASYPVPLPYAIAETVKGFGFPGAGTNAAHNLPLVNNPYNDESAREQFNAGCERLFVPFTELKNAIQCLNNHQQASRVEEKNHYLRQLVVNNVTMPNVVEAGLGECISPMAYVDEWFSAFVKQNPKHRVRIGNPDEMRSNRMNKTLDLLQHRVTSPESVVAESTTGSVITALNEEAIISAALANKQGINLAVSYEAFAVKMLGAMRQEVIFARHMLEAGRPVQWLSVPVVVTSHTWENGKNEQSHQDPTLSEAWLGEMADVAPVYFPFDANTAAAVLAHLYQRRGSVATVVASKSTTPVLCTAEQAKIAVEQGAFVVSHDKDAQVQFITLGTYQLESALASAIKLREQGVHCSIVAIIEPSKFRMARDKGEEAYVHNDEKIKQIIPFVKKRIFVSHTRAEIITGVLRRLDTGINHSYFLGYANKGGTLDVPGMLLANGQSVGHLVQKAQQILSC
jgi:phosphoketolase